MALEFGKIAHRVQPSLFHYLTNFATDITSTHEWLSQSKQQTIGMLDILLIIRSSRTDNCSCVDQNWLLEQGLGDASDSLCKSISREVNGLPLRLTHIAGCIISRDMIIIIEGGKMSFVLRLISRYGSYGNRFEFISASYIHRYIDGDLPVCSRR